MFGCYAIAFAGQEAWHESTVEMRRYLGRASFAAGIAAWGLLLVGLSAGEQPDPGDVELLETVSRAGVVLAFAALPLGAIALIIGPHRLAALFGLVFSILFFLYFLAGMMMFAGALS